MAQYSGGNYPRALAISSSTEIDEANEYGPADYRGQAVGNGVIVKIKRTDSGNPGRNANVLESQQEEDRPYQVEELSGKSESAERGCRCGSFCRQRQSVMADEHTPFLSARTAACPRAFRVRRESYAPRCQLLRRAACAPAIGKWLAAASR